MEITNGNEHSMILERENIDKMICEGKQVEALKILLSLAPMESNNTQEKYYSYTRYILRSIYVTMSEPMLQAILSILLFLQ